MLVDDRETLLAQIAERCRPLALATIRRWAPGTADAEDIVHNAFLRLMESRALPTSESQQRAAVLRCLRFAWANWWAYNRAKARDVYARDSLDSLVDARTIDDLGEEYAFEPLAPLAVEDEVLAQELRDVVGSGLRQLTPAERAGISILVDDPSRSGITVGGDRAYHLARQGRAKLDTHLRESGYPRFRSNLPPYPRNRTLQMHEYNRRRRTASAPSD